jgi:excisionase family DNA binding protein
MERVIRLLTVEEAAQRLEVDSSALWRFIMEGKLTASKIDGRYILSEMQLMFFRRNHSARGVAQSSSTPSTH